MVAGKFVAQGAAEDEAVGFDCEDTGDEADGHAIGDISPFFDARELVDGLLVIGRDGTCGGNILPFEALVLPVVDVVAWFEVGELVAGLAVGDDSSTDTGRESEEDAGAATVTGFSVGGGVGVVDYEDGDAEETIAETGGEVHRRPGKVAKIQGLTVLDGAGEGDADAFDLLEVDKDVGLLRESGKKLTFVMRSHEFEGFEKAPTLIEEADQGLGAADIYTEIHICIVTHLYLW